MSRHNALSIVLAIATLALPLPQLAQARPNVGPGGGGRGGMARPAGGMARPAARPAGAMARPAPAVARPSMPNVQRPQMQRPQMQLPQAQRPAIQRPNSNVQRPAMQRPNVNIPRPGMQRPNIPQRPSLGNVPRPGMTRPSLPTASTRPAPRPGLGSLRPAGPKPGTGIASRPAPAPGLTRPAPGLSRPTTKPAFPRPNIQNRPSLGGDRPTLGNVQRPTTLPGRLPSRPGIGDGNIGSGNLGIGSGNIGSGNWGNNNNLNNINVNRPSGGNWGGNWNGGDWGYPGYGGGYHGGWANNWNNGYVNPHYGGWYNGCWSGNYGYGGGWWAPFALGAATWGLASTIGNWGLGYGSFGYGAMGYPGGAYVNPYYSGIPAAVVAASPYDYSQPVVVNNYVTNDGDLTSSTNADSGAATAEAAPPAAPSDRVFDEALVKFKAGDYGAALSGCDKAVKLAPKDTVIHEVRALVLFALGRYPEAAATLNAVLATAPGMDWTTMSGLYGSVDAYTTQLRKLEEYCRANPDSAAGHFVLAYHYLVGGYADMATEALEVVVAKQPGDAVAKRLLDALTPPKEESAPAPKTPTEGTSGPAAGSVPETDLVGTWLVGTWKASSGKDAVVLTISEDSKFTWKAMPSGKPPVQLDGTIATARDSIALESAKAGTMAGKVVSKGPDAFDFALAGAPADAKPIAFVRQK
jgi:tetratricopeptide (TPR) repeat protein